MIDVKIYNVTELLTNCCLLVDEETGKAAVVDPGAESEQLNKRIDLNGGKLEYVIITHGHYDHIGYAKQLADKYGAKIIAGEADNEFFSNSMLNCSVFHGRETEPFSADILLGDGDKFSLGNTEITYITTPGHTSGSGSYIFDETIITGDTLFCESYGRTDLPTGSELQMRSSLARLKSLEGDLLVIPGHGPSTTLDHERKYNPFMRTL